MNVENILKVADAIEKHSIPDLGFNMRDFIATYRGGDLSGHGCGTCACLAGWVVAVLGDQQEREFRPPGGEAAAVTAHGSSYYDRAGQLLSLSRSSTEKLFFFGDREWDAFHDTTPADAVRTLRHLAKTGEVVWFCDSEEAED